MLKKYWQLHQKSLDDQQKDLSVSHETIRKTRQKRRIEICNDILKSFRTEDVITIHWDGKIMDGLNNSYEKVERLAVYVSGNGKIIIRKIKTS